MDRAAKIFVVGAGLAAGLTAFCAISNAWHEQKLQLLNGEVSDLVTKCSVEVRDITKSEPKRTVLGPFISFLDANNVTPKDWPYRIENHNGKYFLLPSPVEWITCNPWNLGNRTDPLDGLYNQIREKQKEAWAAYSEPMVLPYFIALGVFVIAALPWSWHFVLRRIRELSAAIRGRG